MRKRFDFILTSKDKYPKLKKKVIEKFLKESYDSELGWVRKPNTSKSEIFLDEKKMYSINSKGSRINPTNANLKTEINSFGDSFTFCREVNNDETWQYYLANHNNCNVSNYGVGNYGMDQALLRFKRELKNIKDSRYVVMAVVPGTIQRNLSCWKHYSEFGNPLAFKPRFVISNGKLKLIKNFMEDKNNFYDMNKVIDKLNQYDYFYERFKEQIIKFPYIFNIIKKKKLKQFIIYSGVLFLEKMGIDWRRFKKIISQKIKESFNDDLNLIKSLYNDEDACNLTLEILREFSNVAKRNNIIPIFMMMPEGKDIRDILKNKEAYYHPFLDKAKEFISCVDLITPITTLKNPLSIFFKKEYSKSYIVRSGHYNQKGNRLVAEELNKTINSLKA